MNYVNNLLILASRSSILSVILSRVRMRLVRLDSRQCMVVAILASSRSTKRFCRRCQGAFLEFCDPPSLVGKARPANGIWDMWDNNILSGEGHRRCRRRSPSARRCRRPRCARRWRSPTRAPCAPAPHLFWY